MVLYTACTLECKWIWYPQVGMIPYLVSVFSQLPCWKKAFGPFKQTGTHFCSSKVVAWWFKLRTWPIKEHYYGRVIKVWYRTKLAFSCNCHVERKLWSSQENRDPLKFFSKNFPHDSFVPIENIVQFRNRLNHSWTSCPVPDLGNDYCYPTLNPKSWTLNPTSKP